MALPYTPTPTGGGVRAGIQRFGGHLAGMVMPNIAAFIAFGLVTALFIPTGWVPNKTFAALVDPLILTLLPILIGYTGGRLVHGQRGAVVGAVATMGVVVGAKVPMFLGAMIIGPLAAYVMKQIDGFTKGRIKAGFEMLVENFTAGIVGAAMALLGVWGIGPIVRAITNAAGDGVDWLIGHHLLPFAAVLIEPAKVLFLNNAVNHGVLGPLGVAETLRHGKSIMFMLESNPGPGLGVLLAFTFFGPRALRPTTPAAIIIHFFGGIHEIYFPYILMKPRMIVAAIAGGAAGIGTFMVTGAGLIAAPAPGSIFAYVAETPKGGWFGVFAGVLIAAAVSFGVGSTLLGFGRFAEVRTAGPDAPEGTAEDAAVPDEKAAIPHKDTDEDTDTAERTATPEAAPEAAPDAAPEKVGAASAGGTAPAAGVGVMTSINGADIRHLVIACDAGMGSSVMLAGQLKRELGKYPVKVEHTPVDSIPGDADVVLCHQGLAARARKSAPAAAMVIGFQVFIGDPAVKRVVTAIKDGGVLDG